MMLLAAMTLTAQTNLTDLADLFDKMGDDDTVVPVKVKELRAALWYYHNYFILTEQVQAQGKLLDRYEKIVDDDTEIIKSQDDEIAGFKIAVPILIGTAITMSILYLVEVLRK
jgi:hypothetical protein